MGKVVIWDGSQQIPSDSDRVLVVAKDGFFQLKRLNLAGRTIIEAITKIGPGWDDDSLQAFGGERLCLGFAEKITQALLQQATAFFKAVHDRFETEAIVLLFYAPAAPASQRWQIMAPEQEVTGGHCRYTDPGPARAGWFLAGDIHSHDRMSGSHSSMDDDDENHRDGIHITVGGVNSLPNYAVSAVVNGSRFKLELADIVDGIQPVAFPQQWLQLVRKPAPPTPSVASFLTNRAGEDGLSTYSVPQAVVRPVGKKKGG